MTVETKGGQHLFQVEVSLGDLSPNAIRVELYADGAAGEPATHEMKLIRQPADTVSGHVYGVSVPATRPVADYTARLIPHCEGVAIPLEVSKILWQR
jgi:starch phosphorylase